MNCIESPSTYPEPELSTGIDLIDPLMSTDEIDKDASVPVALHCGWQTAVIVSFNVYPEPPSKMVMFSIPELIMYVPEKFDPPPPVAEREPGI